ncbi:YafY family protein [Thalassococcus sp. S3]|uniref:helix-turn-helix transcriptional regulator n=1 Tax=Thalassococcus sp. S3 TaxID=2017482 RepID=UPI0010244463|nr:YafY family protein [Thalassococcus sp. S3]QBF29731.1 transcriptional regulator [Thalassococcus sp. S3]
MSRTARLFQMMQYLRRAAPPVTAEHLAQDLEISLRTVYRDIDALRGLGAVIDGEAGFGYTLIEDAALPPLGFEDEELEALVLGLREVEQIGDADLAKAAGTALSKLQARLPASQSNRLKHAVLTAKRFKRPEAAGISVKALRQATWDERTIDFDYRDAKGAETHRRVDPLGLSYMDNSTVMLAWCHLREDFRVFRLDRMQALTVTEDSFRPRRVPLLREAVEHIRREVAALAERRGPQD